MQLQILDASVRKAPKETEGLRAFFPTRGGEACIVDVVIGGVSPTKKNHGFLSSKAPELVFFACGCRARPNVLPVSFLHNVTQWPSKRLSGRLSRRIVGSAASKKKKETKAFGARSVAVRDNWHKNSLASVSGALSYSEDIKPHPMWRVTRQIATSISRNVSLSACEQPRPRGPET